MISAPLEEIEACARKWTGVLGQGEVVPGRSTVGGGSLPGETLPTCLLALQVLGPNGFLARLRQAQPPVVARLEDDRVVFDPRTVLPEEGGALLDAIHHSLGK
jgi:L-seryl-tRNA(Ser) seleniumtransferase